MMGSSDSELVRRCLAGETAAFDVLYDRYERKVVGLLRRLTANEAEALDLAQETFLAGYRALASWRGRGSFGTWLCGIAARLYADGRRRRCGRETTPLDDNLPLSASESDPLAHCTRQEALGRIEAAVLQLPPQSREVFVLVKIQGFSYREAAEALEVPLGTVQSRLWRAVSLLQVALRDLNEAPFEDPQPAPAPAK